MFFVNEAVPQKWLQMQWIVSFKWVVKGYQECHFDIKDGEAFKALKKIGDNNFGIRPQDDSFVMYCSVLLTAVDSS